MTLGAKPILDDFDRVLARHYRFTEEELAQAAAEQAEPKLAIRDHTFSNFSACGRGRR